MVSLAEIRRLDKRRRRKVRGFYPGVRVMGDPGRGFGKVIGPSPDGLSVVVWWDSGVTSTHSPHGLSIVKKDRI